MVERSISFCAERQSYIFSYPPPRSATDKKLLASIETARRQKLSLPTFFNEMEGPRIKGAIDFSKAQVPVMCGAIVNPAHFSAGPAKISGGIVLKEKNQTEVVLPRCLDLTASSTLLALDDFYSTFGPAAFYASQFSTKLLRKEIGPNSQLRPDFADWHTHQGQLDSLEVSYSCSDILPTEFRVNGEVKAGVPLSVERWNKNTVHRSATNYEPWPVVRTWWVMVSRLKPENKIRPAERLINIVDPSVKPADFMDVLRANHGVQVLAPRHIGLFV
jgi:hypothetical protein